MIFAKFLRAPFLQSSEGLLLNSDFSTSLGCEYQSTGLRMLIYNFVLIRIATPR